MSESPTPGAKPVEPPQHVQRGSFRDLYEREMRLLTTADMLSLQKAIPEHPGACLPIRKRRADHPIAIPVGLAHQSFGKSAAGSTPEMEQAAVSVVGEGPATANDALAKLAAIVFPSTTSLGATEPGDETIPGFSRQMAPGSEPGGAELDRKAAHLTAKARDVLDDYETICGIDGSGLQAGFECRTDEATGEPFVSFLDPDRVGLALSGGGIRSATFNLGLLQGLNHHDVLGLVDYLATVSGGGYVGSWWSAWKHRRAQNGIPPEFPTPVAEAVAPHDKFSATPESYEANEVRHLREFSNFLVPRPGFFQTDLWEGLMAILSGMAPTIFLAVSLFAWAIAAWLAAQVALGATPISAIPMLIVTFSSLFWLEDYWRRALGFKKDDPRAAKGAASLLNGIAAVSAGAALAACRLVPFLSNHRASDWVDIPVVFPWDGTTIQWKLFLPAIAWSVALGVLVVLRPPLQKVWWKQDAAEAAAFRRVSGRVLKAAVAWCVLVLAWELARYLVVKLSATWGTAGSVGLLAAGAEIFRRLRTWVNTNPNRAKTGDLPSKLKPLLVQILAYLVLGWGLVVVSAVVLLLVRYAGLWTAGVFCADALIFVAILWLVDPEQLGLRAYYRQRIVRTYLGASNSTAVGDDPAQRASAIYNRSPIEHPQDDLKLCELEPKEHFYRPLHLICCAANDLEGDHLANLGRGSRSAVVSSLGVSLGNFWRSDTDMTLGGAITASAAAFNTLMGSVSSQLGPAVTFLMAALNLRLGMWTKHPAVAATNSDRRMPGWLFLKEFWSASNSGMPALPATFTAQAAPVDDDVHLSDGAHFENLGLYELVRRHCRYIIVSDCGADPEFVFDDLGNAMRRIREDFGIEIELDVTPLVPKLGKAAQHMVVGTIHYDRSSDYDQGIILYFKPNFVGNEPDDVEQYRARNPAFPQETTADQFYDEAQWEAYRRLGEHAARSALRFMESVTTSTASRYQLFTDAFWNWYPAPVDMEKRMLEQTQRLTDFASRLRQSGCDRLISEMFPELAGGSSTQPPANEPEFRPQHGAVLLTEIAQVLEDAYVGLGLRRTWNLPLNAGWMSMMHRWTRMKSFREWWPILQPMYSRDFSAFLNDQCRLAQFTPGQDAVASRNVTSLSIDEVRDRDIFQWYVERRRGTNQDAKTRFYLMEFVHPQYGKLPVGLLEYKIEPNSARSGNTAVWQTEWCFVAPSFRESKLPAVFLPMILADLTHRQNVSEAAVTFPPSTQRMRTDEASRAYRGDLVRLYKSLGFMLRRRKSSQVLVFRL